VGLSATRRSFFGGFMEHDTKQGNKMNVAEETQPEKKMATMPVGKLLFTISLPLMLSYVLFLAFGLFLIKPYFAWQTTDAEICQMGVEYLSICMIFSFGSVGQILFQFIGAIYRVGVPAIVNQSLNSLMAFGVNFILIRLSATAVAAFGIYMRIQSFVFMPAFGVNNGVLPLARLITERVTSGE
jgi:Na+-driven multidrug efflux pump